MPHMQVIVDGETKYDGPIDNWQLPSQPRLFPEAMGLGGPERPVTPMAKLFMLTIFTELIIGTLEHPRMQPLKVDMKLRGPGCFTLNVDTPAPEQPAIEHGNSNDGHNSAQDSD